MNSFLITRLLIVTIVQNFHIFERLCGKDALKDVVLATIKWIAMLSEEEEKRQRNAGGACDDVLEGHAQRRIGSDGS